MLSCTISTIFWVIEHLRIQRTQDYCRLGYLRFELRGIEETLVIDVVHPDGVAVLADGELLEVSRRGVAVDGRGPAGQCLVFLFLVGLVGHGSSFTDVSSVMIFFTSRGTPHDCTNSSHVSGSHVVESKRHFLL